MAHGRRPPVYPSHIRDLRGRCGVVTGRDHSDGTPIYRVSYVSAGGDIHFLSKPILLQDHALAGSRIIAEFFNAIADEDAPKQAFTVGGAIA
jgi:hypothetical protein